MLVATRQDIKMQYSLTSNFIIRKIKKNNVKERPRGKSANHQILLSQAQKDAQCKRMKLSYQSRGAIT